MDFEGTIGIMFGLGRDPAYERQQIHEISINVGRRLLTVLDVSHHVPPLLASELEAGIRLVTDIQGEVANLLTSMPPPQPLDIASFTHIMGRLDQALGLLEFMEGRLALVDLGHRGSPGRPEARHPPRPGERESQPSADWRGSRLNELLTASLPRTAGGSAGRGNPRTEQRTKGGPPARSRETRPSGSHSALLGARIAAAGGAAQSFLARPKVLGTIAILIVLGGFGLAVRPLLESDRFGGVKATATLLTPAEKLDGRLQSAAAPAVMTRTETGAIGANGEAGAFHTAAVPPGPDSEQPLEPLPPTMEQPYLVVLSTRETTEELLQDFRAFKEQYPSLLGSAKARVDKIEGQDQKIWHRLSLIPPLAHDEAKALCGDLKAAGLTGCWIKPLPVSVAPPPQ